MSRRVWWAKRGVCTYKIVQVPSQTAAASTRQTVNHRQPDFSQRARPGASQGRRNLQGTSTKGQMPITANKGKEKHTKAGRSSSASKNNTNHNQPPKGRETPRAGRKPKHQKTSTNHSHPREEDEHPRAGRSPRPPRDKHRSDTTTKRNRDSPGQEEAPEYQTTNTNHDHQKKNTPGRAEAPKRHQDDNNREEKPQRAAIGQKPTAATKRKRISGGVGTSPRAPKDKQHKIEIGMNEHVQYFIVYTAYTCIYLPF